MTILASSQQVVKAGIPAPSPEIQDEFYSSLIAQSGGISVGIILAFAGSLMFAKWMGVGIFFRDWMKRMEESTDALKELALSFKVIDRNQNENHSHYIRNHEKILDKIDEVKGDVSDLRKEILK